jgi:hypothetical protein
MLTTTDYENLLVLRYRSAGMSGASALHFAQGEIVAIKGGRHWTHGKPTVLTPLSSDEREQFTERAAIMEYDGGMNRRAATLRAFELCFPGDYRECMQIAGETPEGETALYEYLEGLIKKPETVMEGTVVGAETKRQNFYNGKAPDGPPQGRGTRRRGFERMAAYAKQRPV